MAATVNSNINSLTAQRNLSTSQASQSTSIQRISSGLRINSAKDDAAGLAISERFSAQIRGTDQAARNANDGISLAQTAEGALGTIGTNLQRIRELAVQSVNATNSATDRAALQKEVSQLTAEIDRVATQTQFNGTNLLDGTFSTKAFQVGANVGQTITIDQIDSARGSSLGKFSGVSLSSVAITGASDTAAAGTFQVGSSSAISLSVAKDAKAIAAALTAQNIAGLTVTANATSVAAVASGTNGVTAAGNVTLTVNNTTLAFSLTTNQTTNRANAVAAFNAASASTGVTATDTGSGISLTAADGRNITLGTITNAATGAPTGGTRDNDEIGLADAGTTGGSLTLSYVTSSGATGSVIGTGTLADIGTTAIALTGTAVGSLDISTVAGANTAITSVDAALASVNTNRATLGAVQSRFTSTISNLQSTSENLSASRSRIQDADFASETANLSRAQILQQAGTAMVAQANQLPQGVLALLR